MDQARISAKTVAALEVLSVIGSILITVWVLNPLQLDQPWLKAVPGVLILALLVHSHWVSGDSLSELGFRAGGFGKAASLLALPMLVFTAALVGVGYRAGSLNFNSRFWLALAVVPLWGLVQQYLLQAFVFRRIRFILGEGRTWLAIVCTGSVFALVHAPNLALILLTLAGGLLWTWVYERAPNLFALGLSHGIMSAIAMSSLPAWFLQSMSIGYKHLVFQRF